VNAGGGPITEIDGEVGLLLKLVDESGQPPLETLGVAEARQFFRERSEVSGFSRVQVGSVQDFTIETAEPTVPARVYEPLGHASVHSLILFFHGGGFVIGDLETHDPICRLICREAGAVVISIDYRLAPEHPFPAAPEDALAAFNHIAARLDSFSADPTKVFVAGDSAGGTIAAIIASHDAKSQQPLLAGQVLIYPALDHGGSYPSRRDLKDMFPIPESAIEWYTDHYFQGAPDLLRAFASPGRHTPPPAIAPALILTAGYDPLRDEAEAYGAVLSKTDEKTQVIRYEDALHGFLNMAKYLSAAEQAIGDITDFIRRTHREFS